MHLLAQLSFFSVFAEKFHDNFIKDNRWEFLTSGLQNTLIITFFALLMGVLIGSFIAMVRTGYDQNSRRSGHLIAANAFCRLYLTVIRGTPVLIQLLIIYYVIFTSPNIDKIVVAIIAFGINSGAYVAEIIRSGIMSIDRGQTEAGRSLGLTSGQTMRLIIMPQAIKNILPALCNEFIVLLKETSVSGYIAIRDLTKGGDIIRSRTFEAFLPLLAVALIYLTLVLVLEFFVGKLEVRLRRGDMA